MYWSVVTFQDVTGDKFTAIMSPVIFMKKQTIQFLYLKSKTNDAFKSALKLNTTYLKKCN